LVAVYNPVERKVASLATLYNEPSNLYKESVLSEEIIAVLKCESGLDNSKRGKAGEIGIAQFLPSTWRAFNRERGTNLDIYSEEDQLDLMLWAWDRGYQNHWTCWKQLYLDK